MMMIGDGGRKNVARTLPATAAENSVVNKYMQTYILSICYELRVTAVIMFYEF